MERFAYLRAETVAAAAAALAADPNAVLKAGGVDVLDLMKEHLVNPSLLVDISGIAELRKVEADPPAGSLTIGALVTLAQLAREQTVQASWPALATAAATAATPQIRTLATVGGNLCQRPRCWYFRQEEYHCRRKGGETCYALIGDNRYHSIFPNPACVVPSASTMATPLLAYGATLHVVDKTGKPRPLALADFFVTPDRDVRREHVLARDEVLTAVVIPQPPEGEASAYLAFKHKSSFDWPLVEVAVALRQENDIVREARVVLGSVASVPFRIATVERVLVGQVMTDEVATRAGTAATEGVTPLPHNGYKVPLLAEVVRRTLLKAVGKLPAAEEVMV